MLRLVLAVPLIVVLVVFALSNRQVVTLDFLGYQTAVALSVAVLLGCGVFFLLGALIVWVGELRQRRRARRAEQRVRVLEAELATRVALPVAAPLPLGTVAPYTAAELAGPVPGSRGGGGLVSP